MRPLHPSEISYAASRLVAVVAGTRRKNRTAVQDVNLNRCRQELQGSVVNPMG